MEGSLPVFLDRSTGGRHTVSGLDQIVDVARQTFEMGWKLSKVELYLK
jgi:hypothetical protein